MEIAFAQLEKLLSHQLDSRAEKAKVLLREAELAPAGQIHPHFCSHPAPDRHADPGGSRQAQPDVQLAFMRSSMKLASSSLVPLEQEEQRLKAYWRSSGCGSGKLDIRYRREEGIEQVPIPPFTLQPWWKTAFNTV